MLLQYLEKNKVDSSIPAAREPLFEALRPSGSWDTNSIIQDNWL